MKASGISLQNFHRIGENRDSTLRDSLVGKESACNAGDASSIPESGRSTGERIGYPLQYSGLENSLNCIVHGVSKSRKDRTERLSLTSPPLEGTNKILHAQNLTCTKTQEKGAVTTQKTEPDLVLEGLLWRCGSAIAYCEDRRAGSSSPGRGPLAYLLLKVTINPTIEFIDPRPGCLRPKN